VQGRRKVGGGPGKIFLEATISNFFPKRKKKFREKIFSDEYVEIAFQTLYLNFSYQISVISPKKQIYLALCAEIFNPQK
jgi:hypothetical protein